MTGTQQVPISHVCDLDENKSEDIPAEKNLLQVCSTDVGKSESVIVDESSTEESETESVHKSTNTNEEKYEIGKTQNEEPLVTDNKVINKPSYFNLFKCGKNILNRLDTTCEQACTATSRDKYYTEMYKALTDYNDHTNTPLFNQKI